MRNIFAKKYILIELHQISRGLSIESVQFISYYLGIFLFLIHIVFVKSNMKRKPLYLLESEH